MTDSHLHLYPHQLPDDPHPDMPPDGPYPLERVQRFVAAAAARGVERLAFTEHFYRFVESEDVLGPFWEQGSPSLAERTRRDILADRSLSLERFVDVILRAKEAGMQVLLGVEVDYFPETIEDVVAFLEPYPVDVLVGSVHWIGGFGFDKGHSRDEWERRGRRSVYEHYFRLVSMLAASGLVDVIAHPDRVKMSDIRLSSEPVDLYESLVESAVSSDVSVEINSGGLRHDVGEVYPTMRLLEMFAGAGLSLTMASDAHVPEYAGWMLDHLSVLAIEAGFTDVARYERRQRILEPLVGPNGDMGSSRLRAR